MSAGRFRVRMARAGDVPALAALAAESYRFGFAGILDEAQFATRDQVHFQQRFATEWPFVALAEDGDGRCRGFVEVRDGTLDMLFVSPDAAGTGCAVALLRHGEAMGAVRLECFAANARARRFYEREGWRLATHHERDFAGQAMRFVRYERPVTVSA